MTTNLQILLSSDFPAKQLVSFYFKVSISIMLLSNLKGMKFLYDLTKHGRTLGIKKSLNGTDLVIL
jgi:hypothetical protein